MYIEMSNKLGTTGDRIRERRKAMGYSQEQLAEVLYILQGIKDDTVREMLLKQMKALV